MKVIDSEFEKRRKEKELTAKNVLEKALPDADGYSKAVVILTDPAEGHSTLYTNSTPAVTNMILDVAKINVLGGIVDDDDEGDRA